MSDEISLPNKKIKLILSDLHLGRGRLAVDGSINTFEEFYYSDKLVEFIQYYSAGAFKDYDVEIVLNGDILNFLHVDYRGHYLTEITESISLEILKTIVLGHTQVFKAMGEFLSKPNRRITYVIGNHDQPMMFQACRSYLDQVIGHPLQYKNIVYFIDGIHIEHGHMHDAANRVDPRKFFVKKNMIEPVLNLPFGSHFFIELVLKVKQKYPHVDKVRPFGAMIRWALFSDTRVTLKALGMFIKYFYEIMTSPEHREKWSIKNLFRIFMESALYPDYAQAARNILGDGRVHSVVFGHTHVYEYHKWGNTKEYFNTGTWTELTSLDMASLGRITKLTYVLFEYLENESQPRGRLKEWRGFHRIEEDVIVA